MKSFLHSSFTEFFTFLRANKISRCREREVVSWFVTSALINKIKKGTWLNDPSQIVVEAAVPQLPVYGKKQCCKDLVIWNKSFQTYWNEKFEAVYHPAYIIEWKVVRYWQRVKPSMNHDFEWLSAFSKVYNTVCISVNIEFKKGNEFVVEVITFLNGKQKNKILY